MIRAGIAEDVAFERETLEKHLHRFATERCEEITCETYENGEALLRTFTPGRYDLLLLDVSMPRVDGMTAARRIRRQDERVVILFITSMVQCAVQGYSVDALDFLVKPVSYTGLRLRLDRALSRIGQNHSQRIQIRCEGGLRSISISDIRYVETCRHRIVIHTADEALLTDRTMKQIESELIGQPFFRCHTSYLVNFRYVDRIQGNDIDVDGHLLSISRYRRRELMDAWAAYLGESI